MAVPAWVSEVGIAGTWTIAVAAIWGDRIKAWLFKPKLKIELRSERGELTARAPDPEFPGAIVFYSTPRPTWKEARYYHLRVKNVRRFPVAHEVQVVVTKVETPGPNGQPQTAYTGPLPLAWRNPKLHPAARTVGAEAEADLFYITDERVLYFTPMITPENFPSSFQGRTRIWVTVIARAIEADSVPVCVAIAWDGEWVSGEAEMAQHVNVAAS